MPRIAIIGAGLAGSLLAIYLAKRGIKVDVYEARGDMRLEGVVGGRSINLALSDRGITALREVGIDEFMLAEAVPMYGRMIHSPTGETKLLPYSGRKSEYINSISRSGLNIALMNEAEKHAGVRFHFQKRCVDFDITSGEAKFADGDVTTADTVIATDGAGSAVRQAMEKQVENFQASTVFLEHGYKELHIPAGADGSFLIEKNALHIWPRHQFMMIALPNWDGSFTCTLFLARSVASNDNGGPPESTPLGGTPTAFDDLVDENRVEGFFEREFPDAVELIPTLVEDFFSNPTGDLGTTKCWPWNVGDKALLLGDAAHAMVPFYGQGMNCAFEDVRVLASLIDQHGTKWQTIYDEYSRLRKENTDAIADMAEENFYEMRDRVSDPVFQQKRELETRLEQTYPDYFSKYSMVTFREDMPYSAARAKGNAQDDLLMKLCADVDNIVALDLEPVIAEVRRFMKIDLAELGEPVDISIPLRFGGPQPNAYGVEPATSTACEYGDLVGDTRRGGSCNFEQVTLIPHCNGTHTECVGHITDERISVRECLKDVFVRALVASTEPRMSEGDEVIGSAELEAALQNPPAIQDTDTRGTALIVRTLPNDDSKLSRVYDTDNIPPYFLADAMEWIVESGFRHLLVDLPSIDRLYDDGKLANHRIFWNVEPTSRTVNSATRMNSTITELIYVPNEVEDGEYLLNLQIAPWDADASPSRPLLFRSEPPA